MMTYSPKMSRSRKKQLLLLFVIALHQALILGVALT